MKRYLDKQKRKFKLTLTEFALVQRIMSYSAYANDFAQLSTCELLPEETDCLFPQNDVHNKKKED